MRKAVVLVAILLLAGGAWAVTGGVDMSGTVVIGSDAGPEIGVTGSTNADLSGNPGPNTVNVTVDEGTAVFTSSGRTHADVDIADLEGTTTRVTDVNATTSLMIDPADKPAANITGQVGNFVFHDPDAAKGNVDFSYEDNPDSVQLRSLPANTKLHAIDTGFFEVVDTAQSDTSGKVTFDSLDNFRELDVVTSNTSSLSNLQPQDGASVDRTVNFSVDVNDNDFSETYGDDVEVQILVNGTVVETTNLTSAGTVQYDTVLPVGDHTWQVEAVDQYGNTVSSGTRDVTVEPNAPTAANGSPDGETLHTENVTASVDVSDDDFDYTGGDEVQVTWYLDGNSVATENVTQDSTVNNEFTGLADGSHSWHVELVDSYGATGSSSTYSFDVQHRPPEAANPSPDGTTQNSEDATLSIDVADPDFPVDGDDVEVEFTLDGSVVHTENVTSNQTVTYGATGLSDGQHTWSVDLADSYGYTGGTNDVTFTVDHRPPALSSASPSDSYQQDTETVDYSFDVSDHDFAVGEDSVDVDVYLDGSIEDTYTVTSNQTLSGDFVVNDGSHTWRVEAVDSYGLGDTITQRSFTVEHHGPSIDNSTADPDGATQDDSLSVDVVDQDWTGEDGDSVTVEFFVNGQSAGTDTLTGTNAASDTQTASVDGVSLDSGKNDWYAVATDSYGYSDTSQTFGANTPEEISVFDEENPTQLVQNATLEFYFPDGSIVERDAPTGTADMTGLPATQDFVVVADAPGFRSRRVWVSSITQQQDIYLLNETTEAVAPRFELSDYTGNYPSEDTVLEVQRNINESWVTIEGDYFGASGDFEAILKQDVRHRMLVRNTVTGASRPAGTIQAGSATIIEVEVFADDTVVLENGESYALFQPTTALYTNGTANVTAEIRPGDDDVGSWTVTWYADGQQVAQETGTGAQTIEEQIDMTDVDSVTGEAEWQADGVTRTASNEYTVRTALNPDGGVVGMMQSIPDRLPGPGVVFTTFIAFIVTVLAMGTVGARSSMEVAGATGVGVLVGFYAIGFVPVAVLAVSAVTYIAFVAWRWL